jgi:hypothetical protein
MEFYILEPISYCPTPLEGELILSGDAEFAKSSIPPRPDNCINYCNSRLLAIFGSGVLNKRGLCRIYYSNLIRWSSSV